jgi:acetylglutamate kinase
VSPASFEPNATEPNATERLDQSTLDLARRSVDGRTVVAKLGGSIGGEDTLPDDVTLLQSLGARVVLVHGGGPLITSWLSRIGKETRFVRGLRFTDEETLDVVRMSLSGLVNGEVVARIGFAGGHAVGLTGTDDRLLLASVRDEALGLVGEVDTVNPRPIQVLLDAGYIVVVAPVAVAADATFLNINGDTATAAVSTALGADRLVFLTDVDGVRGVDGHPIRRMAEGEARRLIAEGVISGGMIPKVEACLYSLARTAEAQIVDGRRPHALVEALTSPTGVGTILTPDPS